MDLIQEPLVLYYTMKVMLEELNDHKIHKSPKPQEVFNSEKCFCNKFLNLGKQYLTSYLRDAGRHHYDVGLKSNLSRTRTLTFSGWISLSSGHHHSDMVQQSGLPTYYRTYSTFIGPE